MRRRKPTPLKNMTAKLFQHQGFTVGDVERTLANIRFDFPSIPGQTSNGFADLIAYDPFSTWAIQVCRNNTLMEHKLKMSKCWTFGQWLNGPSRHVGLMVWRQTKAARGKVWLWSLYKVTETPNGLNYQEVPLP